MRRIDSLLVVQCVCSAPDLEMPASLAKSAYLLCCLLDIYFSQAVVNVLAAGGGEWVTAARDVLAASRLSMQSELQLVACALVRTTSCARSHGCYYGKKNVVLILILFLAPVPTF